MQQLQSYSINAPGFMGLNTEDSPTDLQSGYALVANNCIIDQYGRMGSRKGWQPLTTTSVELGVNTLDSIGEHIANDGVSTVICGGANKLFKYTGSALVELTYGGGGVAPVITASDWKMVSLDGYFLLFQIGHDPLAYQPSVSTTQYRRLSEVVGYSGVVQLADVAINAFGRVWNACTTTDKVTIQFSDSKLPHKYIGGTSGTLDLTSVWPTGGDSIVGLGAHNNRLFIFGKQHILIYKDAATPSTMSLEDAISGIGAVSRDSICETGTDILFLSLSGVLSISRTIQEKSAPIRDISRNVRTDLLTYLRAEDSKPIAVWDQKEGFYLLHLKDSGRTYCFDSKVMLQDGSARTTTWSGFNPTALFTSLDGVLYLGKAGYLGNYASYLDNTATYRLDYKTTYTDFGTPIISSLLKKIHVIIIGGNDQTITTKWAFDYLTTYSSQQQQTLVSNLAAEYNIGQYSINEYSADVPINMININAGGSGKCVQICVETNINGYALSIQKLEIYTKNGKLL